jgi:hypothetical protein
MLTKKPKIGDIIEIETTAGLAYLQYTHEDRDMGALVRILPRLHSKRPADFEALAKEKELYFTFYTLDHAIRKKWVSVVSNQPVPEFAKPLPTMRHPGMNDRFGKPEWWIILQAGTPLTLDFLRKARKLPFLTRDQEKLSINSLWSHPSMVSRLTQGWTPETAGALQQGTGSETTDDHRSQTSTRHYLYFPNRTDAETAGECLKSKGYSVEVRRSGDDKSWLVLATQEGCIALEEVDTLRDEMESLASNFDGEYDGWELALVGRN